MTDHVDVRATESCHPKGPQGDRSVELAEPTATPKDDHPTYSVKSALIQPQPTALSNRRSLFRR